jgi:hypothetical protein
MSDSYAICHSAPVIMIPLFCPFFYATFLVNTFGCRRYDLVRFPMTLAEPQEKS